MTIKKEILTVLHETLPSYLVLQEGANLAKHIRGHLRALQVISCIGYGLLYDWPSHVGEQILRVLSWDVLLFLFFFFMFQWK